MAKWKTIATTPALTTTAATAAIDCSQMKDLVAVVSGVTTGTLHVEVSEDNVVWTQVGSNLTANGRPDAAMPRCRYARLRASVSTTIAAKLTVSGEAVATQRGSFSNS